MKAMILAAGFGTRLEPYTKQVPKPLFTLNNQTILEHNIQRLFEAGCDTIVINTHHLGPDIEQALEKIEHRNRIVLLHEPEILDTGGGIANAESLLKDGPFFVINADTICNIDLKKVFQDHTLSKAIATLVLYDFKPFNKVKIDPEGYIQGFETRENGLTFTGIQVLSPEIFNQFPLKKKFSSIEVYQKLIPLKRVKAYVNPLIFWADIGTPESYSRTSALFLCSDYFKIDMSDIHQIQITLLAGDGSDRKWYRARFENQTIIVSDHGICLPRSENEMQFTAFIQIGSHLYKKGIPVPRIHSWDRLSGMVLVEDLGDIHLEKVAAKKPVDKVFQIYSGVIDQLIDFSRFGAQDFDLNWTCQTQTYSKKMILKYECTYFIDAFVNGFLNLNEQFKDYEQDFNFIAEHATHSTAIGLMHRDFQSRNIMVSKENIYFIDFQSARMGPVEYDLASLLIDPYVGLSDQAKEKLVAYTQEKLGLDPDRSRAFKKCLLFCSMTRNLQFLGAFAFLSQVKNKKRFERYIPDAVNSLDQLTIKIGRENIPELFRLVKKIKGLPTDKI